MSRSRASREAFVYGLRDPRVEDPVLSIRYIGQTSVGLSRPKVHFNTATTLRADGNRHKARWINQLKDVGLVPEIVVLERVEGVSGSAEVAALLDAAERRLIAAYKQAGALLTNVQEGGTSGYVLSDEERQRISIARAWQPRASTLENNTAAVVLEAWTPAKAWWLGVAYARGTVRDEPGRRGIELRTESLELAEKWGAVGGVATTSIRLVADATCWAVPLMDVRVARWLIERYAFHEKWVTGLDWPGDLPDDLVLDFARGLWDAKSHMQCTPRIGRQPMMRTSVESNAWRESFVTAFVARVQNCCLYRIAARSGERDTFGVAARGASTSPFLKRLYENAPASICYSAQKLRAAEVCQQWEQAQRSCEGCGVTIASGSRCRTCAKRKWDGKSCVCGRSPVVALGLCAACYRASWEKRNHAWSRDAGVVAKLEAYDIAGWQAASEAEQTQRLDELVALYRSRGFPWFVVDAAESDGVLDAVRKGKLTVHEHTIRAVSGAGQTLCSKAHPHRLRTSYRGNPSVVSAFEDDKLLRRALRFQLKHGDPVTPKRVLRALSALYKGPTNFAPTLARWVVDSYAPSGGTVLDPCAGFGGRLLGALASEKNVRYFGIDIEAKTVKGNQRLCEWVGAQDRCTLRQGDALKDDWPSSDLVFTGPPYFDREHYGSAADQVVRRYSTLAEWVEGFLGTLVTKALLSAPVAVFNMGSIHVDGVRHPLPDLLEALIVRRGGVVDRSWRWELPTFGKFTSRDERLIVMRRKETGGA